MTPYQQNAILISTLLPPPWSVMALPVIWWGVWVEVMNGDGRR